VDARERASRELAERRRVEAAMQTWRRQIAQDTYAGLTHPDRAYSLASVFDGIALHWRDQPADVRSAVLGFVELVERDAGDDADDR